jgi:hypothetical protein
MVNNVDRVLRPRNPGISFDGPLPRHWLAGSGAATHLANAVNLLFPAGERFFIRSVAHFLPRIEDPVLRAQVKGFFGQEGEHARTHERFFQALERQGFQIRPFLQLYHRLAYDWLERVTTPELRLAGTAALEHFTALMAEGVLTDPIFDEAHPALRHLLKWHAAEELEHKAVAFDVLARVRPDHGLRMAGMALAATTLCAFWMLAVVLLVWQDPERGRVIRELFGRRRWRESILGGVFVRGIREYARRDFHPSQRHNLDLARTYLESAGLDP